MYYYENLEDHKKYRKQIDFWAKVLTVSVFTLNLILFYRVVYLSDKFYLYLASHMIFGLVLFEWAWYNTQRVRQIDEERDSCYPAFRRLDAKHWSKNRHYFLAATLLPVRFYFGVNIALIGGILFSKVILAGYKERPIIGWRKWVVDVHSKYLNHLMHLCVNAWIVRIDLDDFDYSPWLGKGYKESQELPKKTATYIGAPHASWMDDTLQQIFEQHAFCIKAEAKKVPGVADLVAVMQPFYIDRKAGDDAVK